VGAFSTSIVTRSMALAIGAAALLLVATQVPLVTVAGDAAGAARLVPLDTWAAGQFPAARDVYRAYLADLVQPKRLPMLALFVALLAAAVFSCPERLGAWLAGRVPALSARSLGLFRLALGLAMLQALRSETPPGAIPLDLQRAAGWLARQDLIRQLAATADAGYWLWQATSLALIAFALGIWARVALVAAAALMTLFVGLLLTSKGAHDWGVPLITLWALTLVPWHDSSGLQTVFARWRGRPVLSVPPAQRGLAVWLPGLTIGLALAAAAFAKLDTSGIAWISSGAVRFHFIEDARQAPVPWGLSIAGSDTAAVALSLAAITLEAGFWLVTLVRSNAGRALFGLAGLGMLLGFYLFQGVFWPGWWALFLAFAPWSLVDRLAPVSFGSDDLVRPSDTPGPTRFAAASTRTTIPARQTAVIVACVLLQILVSALRIESEPFISDYSMYSYTWPSKEVFDVHLAEKTARYELGVDGLTDEAFENRLRQVPAAIDVFTDAIGRASRQESWPDTTRARVAAVRDDYFRRFGERLSRVEARVLQRGFDWARGAFDESPHVTAQGVLDLDAERFDEAR
jgi:hypothetical protein